MKIKKILAIVLAAAAAATAFTGCGNSGNGGGKTVLKYIMPGPGKQQDSDKVWAAWNKKLQEKLPNVEVQFEVIPLSEYKQKFSLMNSAKEQIDIANNYGLSFAEEITNGTFAPLDDLINSDGKDLKAALPDWFMNYQKVNGKTYGIPSYQMCAVVYSCMFIKEYAEKYLDIDGFTNEIQSHSSFTTKAYDYLDEMLAKAKADGVTFKTAMLFDRKDRETLVGSYSVSAGRNDEPKVENYAASEEVKEVETKRAREWFEKGYIRQDVVGATDTKDYIGKKDGVPFWDGVYTPFVAENLSKKYGLDVLTIPYDKGYFIPATNSAAGTSIMQSSKHQKEAMQVLNLLQSDKELYNLLVYGIEGDHYKKTGDDKIETVAKEGQATANDKYGLYKWIVGNTYLAYDNQTEPEGYKKWVFDEVNKSDWRSKLMGFVPDTTAISTELSQITAIDTEYSTMLNTGAFADWESRYAEYKQKLATAGDDKVKQELQKQVDAYIAKNK